LHWVDTKVYPYPILEFIKFAILKSLLGFFASFVLETELVQQIMGWDMTVLRESPWYQEIRQEGRQEALQEGEQRGKLKGEQSVILRQLARRLENVTPGQQAQIRALSIYQLEALAEALLGFSEPNELTNWLHTNQG
jgi:predicted transposase YdaD